jgi:hypothetical protein
MLQMISSCHHAPHIHLVLTLFESFPAVSMIFAPAESYLHLYKGFFAVHGQGDYCHTFFGNSTGKFADLFFMYQQTAFLLGLMIENIAFTVNSYMGIDKIHLAPVNIDVCLAQTYIAGATALDLGTGKFYAGFQTFQNFVIMACLAIAGKYRICGIIPVSAHDITLFPGS